MTARRLASIRGAGLIEMVLLIGVVALVAAAAARVFGGRLAAAASRQAGCVASLSCDPSLQSTAHEASRDAISSVTRAAETDAADAPEGVPAASSVANGSEERDLLADAERVAESRPRLSALPADGIVPLWVGGVREPRTYGEQSAGSTRVTIRAMPYMGATHVVAEIWQSGATRARVLNMGVQDGRTMNYDDASCCRELVGTFYMKPDQLARFETVYRAHERGHVYALGDSNLAMHNALISAGFSDGVGLLSTHHFLGYFGYDNPSLLRRPESEVPRLARVIDDSRVGRTAK